MNDQQPTSGGRRRLLVVALAIALAALVAGILVKRARGASDLPEYALTFTMGEEVGRGEPVKAVPELKRGSRFVLTLRPATPPQGPLSARAQVDAMVSLTDHALVIDGAPAFTLSRVYVTPALALAVEVPFL